LKENCFLPQKDFAKFQHSLRCKNYIVKSIANGVEIYKKLVNFPYHIFSFDEKKQKVILTLDYGGPN